MASVLLSEAITLYFDDEQCIIPDEHKQAFDELPPYYSHLYMAIGGKLAAVILIEDPLRDEAKDTIDALRSLGVKKYCYDDRRQRENRKSHC